MRPSIILLIACCATLTARAQEPYSHYLDHTCVWHQYMSGADGLNYYYSRLTFYIDGDTAIGGVPYFKQYYVRWDSTVHEMFPGPPTVTTGGPNYYRALREDADDRFWQWRQQSGADLLVNDFRLGTGDPFPNDACAIDSVDIIYFNGVPLKRFMPAWMLVGQGVIEGIGDTGPLCTFGFESNAWLICFSKQGETLQLDTIADCSLWPAPIHHQVSTGTPGIAQRPGVRTYPNPTADPLTVEWTAGTVDELLLLNAQGAVVERRTVSGGVGTQLHLGTRAAGVYQLQFRHAGSIAERRTVIKE